MFNAPIEIRDTLFDGAIVEQFERIEQDATRQRFFQRSFRRARAAGTVARQQDVGRRRVGERGFTERLPDQVGAPQPVAHARERGWHVEEPLVAVRIARREIDRRAGEQLAIDRNVVETALFEQRDRDVFRLLALA